MKYTIEIEIETNEKYCLPEVIAALGSRDENTTWRLSKGIPGSILSVKVTDNGV